MCVSERELREAKDDAEYYRNQTEELQQRERDRADERRRQTKEDMRRRLPTNRLYHGDVTDFSEAVGCHIAACENEITSPQPDDDESMRKTIEHCNQTMSESIAQANKARQIYDQITAETEARIVEALTTAGLTEWAECLESGDYSPMAI